MITTIDITTVHVLNILDQTLLHMLAVTTIVSLVILEHLMVNMPYCIILTHYGMEQVVCLTMGVAMRLECHGSSANFLKVQLGLLKSESVATNLLLMKVLWLNRCTSIYSSTSAGIATLHENFLHYT